MNTIDDIEKIILNKSIEIERKDRIEKKNTELLQTILLEDKEEGFTKKFDILFNSTEGWNNPISGNVVCKIFGKMLNDIHTKIIMAWVEDEGKYPMSIVLYPKYDYIHDRERMYSKEEILVEIKTLRNAMIDIKNKIVQRVEYILKYISKDEFKSLEHETIKILMLNNSFDLSLIYYMKWFSFIKLNDFINKLSIVSHNSEIMALIDCLNKWKTLKESLEKNPLIAKKIRLELKPQYTIMDDIYLDFGELQFFNGLSNSKVSIEKILCPSFRKQLDEYIDKIIDCIRKL